MHLRSFAAAFSLALLALLPTWSPAQVTTTTTTTTTTVHDGPHVIVPQVSIHPHRRRPHTPPATVELTAVNANISVDEQVSATTIELTLTNRSRSQQEAVILLPVPDGVVVRSLLYDGVGPEPTAKVLPREEARSIYDAIVRSMRDPALVEFAGYNLIKTSAFPIPPGKSQKLSLTYEQVLPQDGDRVDYALPRSEALSGGGAWTIHADIRSQRPITGVYSPSHEITTTRINENHVRIELIGKPAEQPGAVRFSYLLGRNGPLSVSTMAYPDPALFDGKGGFFMMLAGLPSASHEVTVKRELILVIDRSGSMKGEKMAQALAAAAQIIEGLELGEAFNIIDYSDSIQSFAAAPVVKSRETASQAKAYLSRIQASGGTNIHDALLEALRSEPTQGMLPMVLFLTDGLPTVGERSEVAIREAVKKANDANRRIFSFGVGFDVNTPLLSGVSKTSRGAATFVLPDEDVEVKVSQVFKRLAGPILAAPRLTVRSGNEQDTRALRELLPAELPDLFDGDQIVLTGQYTTERPVTLRLSGEYLGEPRHFDFELDVSKASTRHSYVPRIWANRKVAALVDHIRQAAADTANPMSEVARKEIVEEIIALSTKYGILTEYTAFLATEPETRFDAPARRDHERVVEKQMSIRAERLRAGAASVTQDRNIQRQSAAATPATVGAYKYYKDDGDQINEVSITTVQNIADRTFFQRKDRWVESQLLATEDQKPDRVIEFGTDEYLTLARELARDNRQVALALGGDVLLQVGKERILVKGP